MGDFLVVGVHSDGKCYTVLPTYNIVECMCTFYGFVG